MTKIFQRFACLLAGLWSLAAVAATPAPPSTAVEKQLVNLLGTDWYGIYMLGHKLGYAQIGFTEETYQDTPVYTQRVQMVMKIESFGAQVAVEIAYLEHYARQAPYELLYHKITERGSDEEIMRVIVEKAGEGYHARIHQAGQTRERDLTFTHNLLQQVAIELWVQQQPQTGDSVTAWEFDDESLEMTTMQAEVAGVENTVADGVPLTYYTLKLSYAKENLELNSIVSSKGKNLSMEMPGFLRIRLEPEAVAKDLDAPLDLFLEHQVAVDKYLGDAPQVEHLRLRISGVPAGLLADAPGQTVTYDEAGGFYSVDLRAATAGATATATEIEEALQESTMFPVTHTDVMALAEQAAGDATTPAGQVARLVDFVHHYIEADYIATPLSVLQIIQQQRGDCTEYSALFTTLARALKIPARSVVGLAYAGDEERAFAHHAWNEVVLDGVWVPVDAAWNEVRIDATHIRYPPKLGGQAPLLGVAKQMQVKVEALGFRLAEKAEKE